MSIFKPCTLGIWRKMALEIIKECERSGHPYHMWWNRSLYKVFAKRIIGHSRNTTFYKIRGKRKVEGTGEREFQRITVKK